MRLTIVIILITVFQLSAARSYGQQFTYTGKNIPIIKFFKEIKKQTGYSTVWSGDDLDLTETVDADYHNAPLEEVLKTSLAGLPIDYVIVDKTISLRGNGQLSKIKAATNSSAIDIRGRVVDRMNQPLIVASVKIRGTNIVTHTDTEGNFTLNKIDENAVLIISYVGFNTVTASVKKGLNIIKMTESLDQLKQVEVVSTGYQLLPKERATGSFVLINNELLNRSVSTDVLERLKGVTSGVLFDRTTGTDIGFSIRGRSTIFANTNPLIVLDNFPYDGDLSTINPNDIENISILKDAAAASIWGVRASNGVVVITTKKGQPNQRLKIGFNSNVTVGEKLDLFSGTDLNVSGYIDWERFLFKKGHYNQAIATPDTYISPVVEILSSETDENEIRRKLDQLKQHNVKNDFLKHYYRNPLNQQYALSFDGGGEENQYFLSVGYDHNNQDYVSDSFKRLSLNAQNTYRLFDDKLQANVGLRFSSLDRIANNGIATSSRYIKPYTKLVDESGNALEVLMNKKAWLDTIGGGRLLDWTWKPKDELNEENKYMLDNFVLNLDLKYKLFENLNIQAQYQFAREAGEISLFHSSGSYYARNLINEYSMINYNTDQVTRPIPIGDIIDRTVMQKTSQNLRLQLNYSKNWLKNSISALAGSDLKDYISQYNGNRLYGYDKDNGLVSNIDFVGTYPNIISGNFGNIPGKPTESGQTDRYFSYFSNAQYAYDNKLIFSLSLRSDASNLFGVKTNQKKVPLWSVGGSWNVTKDFFQSVQWLDLLRFRATYGLNGNVDKTVSAVVTARTASTNRFGSPYVMVVNPPNPNLRWEKIEMMNVALEYSLFNNRLSGNIEYYRKKGTDIIGNSPLAPSSGLFLYKGNSADISGDGFDITVSSANVMKRNFSWRTVMQISRTQDKITVYKVNPQPLAFRVGFPYSGIFSYRWAGLDPQTGDPQGHFNGEPSVDWAEIIFSDSLNNTITYSGPGTPTYFGNILNRFAYRNISLSFNVTYKLGYYFRANSVDYFRMTTTTTGAHQDFNKRWLAPGDEFKTNIPSASYPSNLPRNEFYTNSSILIERGDHIRLQDVRLSYDLGKIGSLFDNANIYLYSNNLGLLWKANKKGLDPESQFIPAQRNISIGFKTHF